MYETFINMIFKLKLTIVSDSTKDPVVDDTAKDPAARDSLKDPVASESKKESSQYRPKPKKEKKEKKGKWINNKKIKWSADPKPPSLPTHLLPPSLIQELKQSHQQFQPK